MKTSSNRSQEKQVVPGNLGNSAAFPSKEMVLQIACPERWHFVVSCNALPKRVGMRREPAGQHR